MKRLTNRKIEIPSPRQENADYWRRVHLKLAAYEDAEEQGLLIKLPCKVGDTVYRIEYVVVKNHNFNYEVGISDRKFNLLLLGEFGKTVFLTREEAESALAKGINVRSKNEKDGFVK